MCLQFPRALINTKLRQYNKASLAMSNLGKEAKPHLAELNLLYMRESSLDLHSMRTASWLK